MAATRGELRIDLAGGEKLSRWGLQNKILASQRLRKSRIEGHRRSEVRNPQLAIDIQLIVEPHTHADPELKTDRMYANLSAKDVLQELKDRSYTDEILPKVRTIRDMLDRMNYRLKRIQKGKPLKKTEQTDAIFENLKAVRAEYEDEPETLQISVDTKAKVSLGEYVQGGKTRTDQTVKLRRAGITIHLRKTNWYHLES